MALETIILIYIFLWMIPCMIIASAKNRSVGNAFLASLFFGLFALIYYIFVGRKEESKDEDSKTFTCDGCGAEVDEDAEFCPKCGAKFDEVETDEDEVECSKCGIINDSDNKFCKKCGQELDSEVEEEEEYTCSFCEKNFKKEDLFDKHKAHCKARKEAKKRENKILLWVFGSIAFLILGIIFIVTQPVNIIPLVLIAFVLTPFFDSLQKYLHNKKKLKIKFNWTKKIILITSIIVLFIVINLLLPECPASCDDGNACTNDFCSSETKYKCMNTKLLNCDGNDICEASDSSNSADCPNCDDGLKCTADYYDNSIKDCAHKPIQNCVE